MRANANTRNDGGYNGDCGISSKGKEEEEEEEHKEERPTIYVESKM